MKSLSFFVGLGLFLLLSTPASAQIIKSVKNQKALAELQGSSFSVGEEYFAIDSQGKKRAILKVKQIKNDRAVLDIIKGTASPGQTLTLKPAARAEHTKRKSAETWGVLGSYAQDKMDANFTLSGTTYTANMQGSGFGILGFYDRPLTPDFNLRGTVGLEQFIASSSLSTAACGNGSTNNCNVNILYLSFYGAAKYIVTHAKAQFWVAGGVGYLFAASKSSNVLRTEGLSTYVIVPSVGVDIAMKNGFLPMQIDYSIYPSTADVKANSIAIRAGWGWYF